MGFNDNNPLSGNVLSIEQKIHELKALSLTDIGEIKKTGLTADPNPTEIVEVNDSLNLTNANSIELREEATLSSTIEQYASIEDAFAHEEGGVLQFGHELGANLASQVVKASKLNKAGKPNSVTKYGVAQSVDNITPNSHAIEIKTDAIPPKVTPQLTNKALDKLKKDFEDGPYLTGKEELREEVSSIHQKHEIYSPGALKELELKLGERKMRLDTSKEGLTGAESRVTRLDKELSNANRGHGARGLLDIETDLTEARTSVDDYHKEIKHRQDVYNKAKSRATDYRTIVDETNARKVLSVKLRTGKREPNVPQTGFTTFEVKTGKTGTVDEINILASTDASGKKIPIEGMNKGTRTLGEVTGGVPVNNRRHENSMNFPAPN